MPAAAANASFDWSTEFRAFTLQHGLTVLVFVGAMVASCWLGRRWLGTRKELRMRLVWVSTALAWQAAAVVYFLLPAHFDPMESWPLHLCDLAAWIGPLALLTQHRGLRSLLYFWGIGLSTQAFVTPVVEHGHGELRYWLFFVGHTHIVGSALYDLVVLGYRPRLRDWGFVTVVTVAWLIPVTAMNIAFDVNYWYTGRDAPGRTTVVHFLGPWPWRLIPMVLGVQLIWAALCIPWVVAERRKGQDPPAPDA